MHSTAEIYNGPKAQNTPILLCWVQAMDHANLQGHFCSFPLLFVSFFNLQTLHFLIYKNTTKRGKGWKLEWTNSTQIQLDYSRINMM